MYILINFCWGSCMWVNSSGPIAMHEPYKSDDILCKNTCDLKKVQPSKVESYLEVNAWTDWRQQDLTSEYGQDLAYWTHTYYTGHIIASYLSKVFWLD